MKDSRAIQAAMLRARLRLLALIVGGLIVGGTACGGLAVWKLWIDARATAKLTASSLGVMFAEQTTRALQPVSLVLQDVVADLDPARAASEAEFRSLAQSVGFRRLLADKVSELPQVSVIAVVGSDGQLLSSTAGMPPAVVAMADRDYVRYCAGPDHQNPFFGKTVRARSSEGYVFPLAYCLDGAAGHLLGVVVAGVSVNYFMDFYPTVGLPPGSSVAVRQPGGQALVRYPNEGESAPPMMLSAVRDDTYVSSHRLTGYALQIEVDVSKAAAFAIWRGQVVWIAIGSAAVLTCLLLLVGQLVALIKRLERTKLALTVRNQVLLGVRRRLEAQARSLNQTAGALTESEGRLARQASLLETTLEHINQGLLMVTSDRVVAVCNRRAMEMLDLPPELMLRRPSFSEVLEHQWRSEEFVFTSEDVIQFIRRGGVLDRSHSYERRRPNGTVIEVNSQPLEGGGLVFTYTDVTLRTRAEQRLSYLAYHDELTGLCNRHALREQVGKALGAPGEGGGSPALLYIDLDRFKLVNDTCGHSAGDDILKQVAQRMQQVMRSGDTAARLGGDEFAVLLPDNLDRETALATAEQVKAALSGHYSVGEVGFRIGISIGVALYPKDGVTTDELLRSADSALYRAKSGGRDAVRMHENAAEQEDYGRMVLEQDLRIAVEQGQFELLYQPIFDGRTGLPSSCEALLRWRHPVQGLLSPDMFIPIAEATGLIKPLGRWVLQTACAEAATWALPVRLAINLSPVQLTQPDLKQQVLDALAAGGLPPERLDLEVTETVLLSDIAHVRSQMMSLQSCGIRLVMDDFGTGHASLEALQGFPFQQIKIDQSFVAGIFDDDRAGAILPAILSMAAAMKLEVVAEGVATAAQVEALRRLGCRFMQGFLLGRPEPPERIRDFLWRCTSPQTEKALGAAMLVT